MFDLDTFRALRDTFGLRDYAESIERHQARHDELMSSIPDLKERQASAIARLQERRADLDEFTYAVEHKRLKREIHDARIALRAAILHERAEIERVGALYGDLAAQIRNKEIA